MFKKNITILLLIMSTVILFSCAKNIETEREPEFYKSLGDKYTAEKKYKDAAVAYENALMRAETPEYAAKMQLHLGDSYFAMKNYEDAIPVYEAYLNVYSKSVDSVLAYLKLGLSYFELMPMAIRDQSDTESALKYFNEVKIRDLQLFEQYNLGEKVKIVRERLSKKEMKVGDYYSRIWKDQPAMLRYKYLVENYSDTSYYPEAVYKLIKKMKALNINGEDRYLKELKVKYPNSVYIKKSEKVLKSE